MKIDTLNFKAGSEYNGQPLTLNANNITIFIGPNNGGKSAALREINQSLRGDHSVRFIFDDIIHSRFDHAEIDKKLEDLSFSELPVSQPGNKILGWRGDRQEVNYQHLRQSIHTNAGKQSQYVYQSFIRHFVLNLDGQNRLGMIGSGGAQNLAERPYSTIAALFLDDQLRKKVSELVYEAFGQYLVIDPTMMSAFRYALANTYPDDMLSRSFGPDSIHFFSNCLHVEKASDGTKAFIGILCEVLAGHHDILIIDEPEAFLHPSLAYLLGRAIARNLSNKKQLFVSTHSPHFLMGCISVGVPIDIVRLTHKAQKATARHLPASQLRILMNDPLLKSIGVLEALFFESAVVVEGDSDRAFYEEINNRINTYDIGGIRHASFLNAHNKQQAPHIVRILRQIGIPTAMILDVDWVKEDGRVGQKYLAGSGIPYDMRTSQLEFRRKVRSSLEKSAHKYETSGGIRALVGHEFASAKEFFDQMERYGLFTVRGGQLESWLRALGVASRKEEWLASIFAKLGSDPESSDYIYPADDDVWYLIRQISKWLLDSERAGMRYLEV
ncbi:ATP-dependent nuclease [Rhizobium oryzicola]|uniref:AAA family ATPase n=1 Tax=Rhizobium oryzicola TaxID=1232668 RepID=A0ABT8T3X4_9HYPH|nr:AAA family ATPase [Rhizobium oryzicola]MDO1585328.1 AAA family ATPase [Rhizobium oryzicola]